MANPAHERSDQPRDQLLEDMPLSLIRGGSLYRAQEKAGLIRPDSWDLKRRLPLAIAVAWIPLVVLAAVQGGLHDVLSVVTDYRVSARVFIAIPMLLVAQISMDVRFREMAQQFLDATIVRDADLSRFHEIVRKTRRLRDAKLPEVVAFVAVYVQIGYLVESGRAQFVPWAINVTTGSLTPAGYYAMLVTLALFLGLMATIIWKWMIWIFFLWRISQLDLQIDATNGDLTGGLGFVGEVPRAFIPVVLAIAAVIGAYWRSQVLNGQVTLQALTWPAGVLALMVLLIFFLPLAVFTPILAREKRLSTRRYGSLQHLVSLQFRRKWTGPHREHVDQLLAGPDVSSLADITGSFKNIEQMRTYPFRVPTVLTFLGALALPLIPVATTQIPLKEILKGLLQAVR
jgi:hypothetical protein